MTDPARPGQAPGSRCVLILGATGLVGQQMVAAALREPDIARVVAPVRRPWLAAPTDPRLHCVVVDYEQLPHDAPWWKADAVLCALGTTRRQAGSREAFRHVDRDLVLQAARAARDAGTPTLVLNSSVGASPNASSFYLRVKGEVERDLQAQGWPSLTVVRPSLLDGGPRPHLRPGESVALVLVRCLRPLTPARYRAVTTRAVAATMLRAALDTKTGYHVIESEQISDA